MIIGISGISGAGKTTFAKHLSQSNSWTAIFWDDFDGISSSPDNLVKWYKQGKDYDEWNYPDLARVLEELKNRNIIPHPVLKTELQPTNIIVFDAPLGRLHEQTGQSINLWVHLEVPLDIALARRAIRDYKDKPLKENFFEDLECYLNESRPLFFDSDLKEKADLVIDGTLDVLTQAEQLKKYLKEYR
ncbi:hypothetical protein GQ61_04245 [Candidatus Nucleicultrix amoebiphila FS5]|jgi:uridine kinase|uniref:Phosphoribulokinase/uridine kinase domain-containing protein n=2 Tax=Candidatus Nucleicultrix TaxID=1509243 RepID=A0A1W6N447_9PROT|nr:hypothetical protein GQ61_04245 [Candidatus Nucleicultrix amoebiphila FS5]